MASRRRKGNPLLVRILLISVGAHVIALPILAHFGAFDKIKKEFGASRVVVVNIASVDDKKQPEKAQKKEPKHSEPQKAKAAGQAHVNHSNGSNLSQPKVVTAGGDGASDGTGGPTVDANATGTAGAVPTAPPTKPPVDSGNTKPEPAPVSTPGATPKPPPVVPKPESAKPELPKPRVFVEAEAIQHPDPVIPDSLRAEPLDKTLIVDADVDASGVPVTVKVATSTGISDLDAVGIETAKKWRFQPATLDGQPVSQHVRFRIEFKVD